MIQTQLYQLLACSLNLETPENLAYVKGVLLAKDFSLSQFVSGASNHLILQNIYVEYKKYDLLKMLPEELQKHLVYVYDLNGERNKNIIAQASSISALLNKEKIPHLYTKGLGHIIDGVYPEIGERILGDIDVVVPNKEWLRAVEILKRDGYYNLYDYDPKNKKKRKHYPRLIKKDEPSEIEVHWIVAKYKYSDRFPTKEILKRGIPSKRHPKLMVMCDEDKIVHNFIHSQLDHEGHKHAHIHLRNLYDMLLLSKRANPYVCIKAYGHFQKEGMAYLALMDKSFGSSLLPANYKASTSTKRFMFKHRMNLKYGFLIYFRFFFMRIPYKVFRHYFVVPYVVLKDKKYRKQWLSRVKSREAWKKHFRGYGKVFGKSA